MLERIDSAASWGITHVRDQVQFVVAANTTRFWLLGQEVECGQFIGRTADDHDPVVAWADGQVVGIEYDVETDELILTVESR
jgi:hypothetical protein